MPPDRTLIESGWWEGFRWPASTWHGWMPTSLYAWLNEHAQWCRLLHHSCEVSKAVSVSHWRKRCLFLQVNDWKLTHCLIWVDSNGTTKFWKEIWSKCKWSWGESHGSFEIFRVFVFSSQLIPQHREPGKVQNCRVYIGKKSACECERVHSTDVQHCA